MQFSHQYIPASLNFSNGYQPFFFFFFSSPSFLHILSNSTKLPTFLSFPHHLISSLTFYHPKLLSSPSSLIFSMAPKSKKTSYVLFSDNSNLTRWNRVVRLNESPPLTYRPQDHLSEGPRTRSVSFSKFSHFPLIFCFNMFLDMYMLGFCCCQRLAAA